MSNAIKMAAKAAIKATENKKKKNDDFLAPVNNTPVQTESIAQAAEIGRKAVKNPVIKRTNVGQTELSAAGNVGTNIGNTVKAAVRAPNATKYYTRPDIGRNSELLYGAAEVVKTAAAKQQATLVQRLTEWSQVQDRMAELSRKIPDIKQYAEKSTVAAGILNTLQQEYGDTILKYGDIQGSVSTAKAEYDAVMNVYKKAWNNFATYHNEQREIFNDWKSSIRKDKEDIRADIAETEKKISGLEAQKREIQDKAAGLRNRGQILRGQAETAAIWESNLPAGVALAAAQGVVALSSKVEEKIKKEQEKLELLNEELDWSTYYSYADLLAKEDFKEKSKYKTTANGKEARQSNVAHGLYTETGFDDITYDYINRNRDAIGKKEVNNIATDASLVGVDKDFLKQMTDEEIAIFNYLYAKDEERGDKEHSEAYGYINYIAGELNYRQRKAEEEFWAKEAEEHPIKSSIFSILESPLKGLSYIGQIADYVEDGKIDQNAGYNKFSYINSAIRNKVSDQIKNSGKWGPVGSFAYQTGMSMGDFLFNTAITGGFTGKLTGLGKISEGMALAIMGTGAAADATIEAKDRGLSDTQAFMLGTIAGAAEIFTEKFSVETLLSGKWEDSVIKYIVKNAFTEGTEELGSDFINLFADIIIAKDKSQWQQSIDAYMEDGLTEDQAFIEAFKDQAISMGLDFAGGALSGGVMSSFGAAGGKIGQAINNRNESRIRTTLPKGNMVGNIVLPTAGEQTGGNTRLTEADLNEYLTVGERQHVRDMKSGQLNSGDSPVLTGVNQVRDFIKQSIVGKIKNTIKAYGKVGTRLAGDVAAATNGQIDINNYYLELDSNMLTHMNKHVNVDTDVRNMPLTEEQILNLTDYIDTYDDMLDIIRRKDGSVRLMLGKKINGHSIIIEAVSKGRRALHPVTAYQISTEKYESDYKTRAVERSSTSLHVLEGTRRDISRPATALVGDTVSQRSAGVNSENGGIVLPRGTETSGITLPTGTNQRNADTRMTLEQSGRAYGVHEDTIAQVKQIGQITGRNIAFYEGAQGENGYYDPNSGTLYINSLSQNPVAQIISHELTHSIEAGDSYGKLQELVLNRIQETGGNLNELRRQKADLYARNGHTLRDNAAIDAEIVAEYVEKNLLTDEASIRELVKQDRTLGQRILEFLDKILAKLGNAGAKNRAFLEQVRSLYRDALNETKGSFNQETETSTGTDIKEDDRYLRDLREQYAAGEITEEEFDRYFDEYYNGGSEYQYSINKTEDNRPFVEVEEDILAGVPRKQWVSTVKENLKENFPDGITVGNSEIKIDGQSRREMTFSGYMQWIYNTDKQLWSDKLRATNNADEILKATTGWVNEGLNHPRNDRITDFARGDVLLRVGGNDYTADVVVGARKNGGLVMYDLLNLQPTSFTKKETGTAKTTNPSPGAGRNTATLSSANNITQDENGNKRAPQENTKNQIILPKGEESGNRNSGGERQYSISETEDGRAVAVVDNDILSHIDTSTWDNTKKAQAKAAAKTALLAFKDGVQVNDVTYKVNKTSRNEYTWSKDTDRQYRKNPDIFADKLRAAANVDDVITATTSWARDRGLKHPRIDNFVDFAHGDVLIQAGENKYSARTVVGITDSGEYVFYDVVNIKPEDFNLKEKSPSTAASKNTLSSMQENFSLSDNITQDENGNKRAPQENTKNQTILPRGEESGNRNSGGERQYSISETEDGRAVAVVDNDILSHIDTSTWDNTKKAQAKAAAKTALLAFKDGVQVNDVTYKVNKTSRDEYTRSGETEKLYKRQSEVFADKLRAAANVDDVITATTSWARDGGLKHPRIDNFVDFAHGDVLIQAGENKYSARTVVGITDSGEYVFYDVVDMNPKNFTIKEKLSTAAAGNNAVSAIQESSSENNILQRGTGVNENNIASQENTKNQIILPKGEESGNRNSGGERQYSISEYYEQDIEEWNRAGRPSGETFVLGATGDVMQGLGAMEQDIYLQGDKINNILEKHPEMTIEEIKRIPEILDDPVLVLKSKNQARSQYGNSRLVMFGAVKATDGRPIMSVLDLRPTENGFLINDMQRVTSAYTKDVNPENFIQRSEILHVDRKRALPLLRDVGFTRPASLLRDGSMGSITYTGNSVNIEGVPFSSVVEFKNDGALPIQLPTAVETMERGKYSGGERQYSISETLDEDLQQVLDGTYRKNSELYIGETSNFLTDVIGADALSVTMPVSKAYSAMVTEEQARADGRYRQGMNYHGLGAEGLQRVLAASENPIAAFADTGNEKGKRANNIVLVTDEQGTGGNIVVVETLGTTGRINGGRVKANKVITSYDRAAIASDIEQAAVEGRLLHLDEKRSQSLLAGSHAANSREAIRGVDFDTNIRNFMANVKWENSGAGVYSTGDSVGKTAFAQAFEAAQAKASTRAPQENTKNQIILPRGEESGNRNSGGERQYSISETLDEDLQQVLDGTYRKNSELYIGETSNFLTDVIGADALSVTMPVSKAYSAMVTEEQARADGRYRQGMNYHGLGAEGLQRVLAASENPIAAFAATESEKGKRANSIVLVTDEQGAGGNIVVVETLGTTGIIGGKNIKANKVITSYDRAAIASDIEQAAVEGRLLHLDKKRSQSLLGVRHASNSRGAIRGVDFDTNIRNFMANVKWENSGAGVYSTGDSVGKTAFVQAFEAAQAKASTRASQENTKNQIILPRGEESGNRNKSGNRNSGGERQYSISKTENNRPFVEVEEDILAGVPQEKWVSVVKDNLKEKFPNGVTVGNNEIKINNQSRREMTFSKYMQRLYNSDIQLSADKLRATNNADEILKAATGWVNEGLKHPRKDSINDFARGTVLLRIGGNDYSADVVVGTKQDGSMIMYDVLKLKPTSFVKKELDMTITGYPYNGPRSGSVSSSENNILQRGTGVNENNIASQENTKNQTILPKSTDAGPMRVVLPTGRSETDTGAGGKYSISESDDIETEKHSIRNSLPVKAQEYLKRTERTITQRISKALNVPKTAQGEYLQELVRDISEEYLKNGRISDDNMERLFDKTYERKIEADEEYYNRYKDIGDILGARAITVTEQERAGIPDWGNFINSSAGTLRIVNSGGVSIDSMYRQLQKAAPELFPKSATAPGEKLIRIFDTAQSLQRTGKSIIEYNGRDAEEFKRWAKNDFSAAVSDSLSELKTVKRYADERATKAYKEPVLSTMEDVKEAYSQLKAARREYEKAKAKNLLTDHDEVQVGRLLRGELEIEHLDAEKDNVKGITAVYKARQEYEKTAKLIRDWNTQRRGQLRELANGYLETANDWKDKKAGFLYARETMERNILDIVGDKKLAKAINGEYFTPVHEAQAKSTRLKNRMRDRVRALNLSTKETRAMLKDGRISEAHAVQLLGEATDNIKMLENSRGRMAQRDGKTLSEWRQVIADMWAQNPQLDKGKIENAVLEFRKIYDELFELMNESRLRNGYEPVNYRKGYFPHFQPGNGDGIMGLFGKALGIKTDVSALPTTINGLTHTFKPGIQWFGNAQERLGFNTTYDAVEGFDKYIEGVSDVIYQTDNIQKLRALASQIRYRTGNEGIRQQVDEILANETLSEQDKQNRIEKIYENGRFTLSNFVVELEEYTNLLANKKSRADRNAEQALGRRMYNIVKGIESRIAANMVAVNPASWLTNFVPITQGWSQLGSGELLRGMWQTLKDFKESDGISDASDFLTNRKGSDPLVRTWTENMSAKLSSPMEYIDQFTAGSLIRARYNQNIRHGLSEAAAMSEADSFAAGVMADRSKGSMPTLFSRNNPATKLFTQFQLEVNNQLSYLFKDLPGAYKDKGLRALAGALFKFFLGAWLYDEVYEYFIGRRPALDPIGMLNDTVGDITGYELPNLVEMGVGLIAGDAPSFKTEKENAYDTTVNAMGAFAEELPFIGGLLGGGRLPSASVLPNFDNLLKAATSDTWSRSKKLQTVGKELSGTALYILPPFGGGQLKKIYQGISTVIKGGSYTIDAEGNEQLQYPVYTDSPWDAAKSITAAVLFGKTALPTGRAWVENGFKSLGAPETAVYKALVEAEIDDKNAYELVRELQRAKGTETLTKAERRRQILRNSEIPGEGKSIAYYGLMASDRERELMEAMTDIGADMGEVTSTLLNIRDVESLNGVEKAIEKRTAIKDSALTNDEKKTIYNYIFGEKQEEGTYSGGYSDNMMAFEQAGLSMDAFIDAQNEYANVKEQYSDTQDRGIHFARWVDGLTVNDGQKETIRDCFITGRSTAVYDSFIAAGVDDDKAYKLTQALRELTPPAGETSITNMQKYRAVVDSDLQEREQLEVLTQLMPESESGKLQTGYSYGVTPEDYVTFKEILPQFDFDGNGAFKQSEVTAALDAMSGGGILLPGGGLNDNQRAALWQIANKSWKPKNNPYSVSVGEKVYNALNYN